MQDPYSTDLKSNDKHVSMQFNSRRVDIVFIISFLLCNIILLVRVVSNISLNQPLAENFSDLLMAATENPFNIFAPVVDGIFVLPRVFASLSVLISPINAAIILSSVVISFHAITSTFIIRKEFEYIIPDIRIRFLLAAFIAFGPGSLIIVGSAICVAYSVVILSSILGMKSNSRFSYFDSLLVLVLALSSHFSIALLPLYAIRAFLFRNLKSLLSVLFILFAFVLNLGPILATEASVSSVGQVLQAEGSLLKKIFSTNLIEKLIFHTAPGNIIYFAGFLIVLLLGLFLVREKKVTKSEHYLFGLGQFGIAIVYCLAHAISRPYGLGTLTDRHAAIMFIPLVIGFSVLFKDCSKGITSFRFHQSLIVVLVLPVIIVQIIYRSDIYNPGRSIFWSEFINTVRSLPEGESKHYSIGPDGGARYWGNVECKGLERVTNCYVTNFNGSGTLRVFDKDVPSQPVR